MRVRAESCAGSGRGLSHRRPAHTRFWGAGCLQNPNRLVTWWIRFRQRDRAFYGLVAVGDSATEETRAQVFQALSSFQVEE
jgi:hypothetical protein